MRQLIFLLCLLPVASYGQNNPTAYNALTARILAINHDWVNEALDDNSFTYALELSYQRQLGNYLALSVPFKVGLIDVGELENPNIYGVDLILQAFPFGNTNKVAPYIHSGYGIMGESNNSPNNQVVIGAGINFRLGTNSWFSVQGSYRDSDKENRNNVMAGLGYSYQLSSFDSDGDGVTNKDDLCPDQPGPASTKGCPDSDGDGLTDQEDVCPTTPGPVALRGCPDSDGDGVIDASDRCPDLAGLISMNGCPDTDGDGVVDPEDDCPNEIGGAATKGCPDGDGDGIIDSKDACPGEAGPARLRGCPDRDGDGLPDDADRCPDTPGNLVTGCPDDDGDGFNDDVDQCPDIAGPLNGCPDTDGDGIADKDDLCPREPGPGASRGCPADEIVVPVEVEERLEYVAQAIQFETGSARLTGPSGTLIDDVADILKRYPQYDVRVSGHTDNTGTPAKNLQLSKDRAYSVRNALISRGIAPVRIQSAGYGDTQPQASNATAAGRALNRRVDFDLLPR